MGFRFRKSINLGGGFRINMSKSGIGYSWGTKGARFSRTASGKRRTTLSVPGTGISYVSETGGKRKKRAASARTSASRNANTNTYGGTDMGWGKFFLCFFLGIFGVHKFVEHKTGMGILYLFTGGLLGFGWLYDCVKYLFAALNTQNTPNNMYGSVPPAPPYSAPPYSAPPYAAPTEVSGGQESGVYTWTPPAPGYPAAPPMMPPAAPTGSNWKKAVKSVLLWALTALFGLLALAFLFGGGVLAGLFALLFVAVVIPVASWQNIVKRFLRGPLKVILAVVLAILFFVAVPPAEVSETEPAEPSPTVSAEEIPAAVGAFSSPTPTVKPTPKPSTAPSATPSASPTPTPEPTPAATPEPTPEPTEVHVAESAPEPTAEPTPQPTPQPTPEPTPEPTEAPSQGGSSGTIEATPNEDSNEVYVWIPQSGTRYHSHSGCSNMDNPSLVTLSDAIAMGYTACGRCY